MSGDNILSRSNPACNAEAFEQAFITPNLYNRIDLPTFLTRRIVAFGRLSMGACPAHKVFWQGQITSYHRVLKSAMTNPIFKAGEK